MTRDGRRCLDWYDSDRQLARSAPLDQRRTGSYDGRRVCSDEVGEMTSGNRSQVVTLEFQRRVLRCAVWLALFLMFLSRIAKNTVDLDVFHQMALIRESIVLGHIPTVDLFAYTPTIPYSVHHEWGAGVIVYAIGSWFGGAGLLLLKYLLAAILAWLCIVIARSRNSDFLPVFAILAPVGILFVGHAFSPVRAHLYTLIFVACLLYFLERDRHGDRRWIAFWLLLSVLWANLHAGFMVGVVMMGAHCFEQLLRRERWLHLALIAAANLLLVAVNPYGTNYYPYLWRGLAISRRAIAEWGPIWQPFPSFESVVLLLSLSLIFYAARTIGLRAMPGIAILCVTAAGGALHHRMIPFYAIAWTCYAPGYILATPFGVRLKALFDRPPLIHQAVWVLVSVFFLNVTITSRPWNLAVPGDGAVDEVVYPTGAVEYLSNLRFKGNVMVPFEYGAYVSWKMYPSVLVSIDSRYEAAYPNWWVDESFSFYAARPGWKQTLAAYPTDVLLVRRTQPLAMAMKETNWRRVYIDRAYEVYERPGLDLATVDYHNQAFEGRFP